MMSHNKIYLPSEVEVLSLEDRDVFDSVLNEVSEFTVDVLVFRSE